METIQIKNDDEKTILYIDGKRYFGYTFYNDGRVKKVDESVFKNFDMFILSKNQTILPNEDNYQVILDNETNFKHYFMDGKEDFIMFFKNNGEDALSYSSSDEENSKDDEKPSIKRFIHNKREIVTKVGALLYAILMTVGLFTYAPSFPVIKDINEFFLSEFAKPSDISADQLVDMINNSSNLKQKEKEFLCNRKLFEFVLQYTNKSNFAKFMYGKKFNGLSIVPTKGVSFYTDFLVPNVLHIQDYVYYDNYMFDNYIDFIAHEFIHLLQSGYHYNVISEALANIIHSEFFDGISMGGGEYSYFKQRTYKLMELIGIEPILNYAFADDFSDIEKNVKPYLNDEEYNSFKNCLHVDNIVDARCDEKNQKMARLDELLNKIYFNKFGKEPSENEPFKVCESPWFVKYYFNDEHFTQEESYCYKLQHIFPEGTNQSEIIEYIKTNKEYQEVLIKRYQEEGESRYPMFSSDISPAYLKAVGIDDIAYMYDGIFLKGERIFLEPSKNMFQNQGKGFN